MRGAGEDMASGLAGRHIALIGKLVAVTNRQAQQLIRQQGGVLVDSADPAADLIIIGADHFPLDGDELLDEARRQAAAAHNLEIITETQLWQRLGLVENEQNVRRLYTPAMLADLLHVPIGTIRRWHRRGLIVPAREVSRLPYFDFQEVATARRLAELLAAGALPAAIEHKLEELARYLPGVERPLAQLSVIVEGQQLLLRQGEGLVEPSGQRRFDFDADTTHPAGQSQQGSGGDLPATTHLPWVCSLGAAPLQPAAGGHPMPTADEIRQTAAELEDAGNLAGAIEAYRRSS